MYIMYVFPKTFRFLTLNQVENIGNTINYGHYRQNLFDYCLLRFSFIISCNLAKFIYKVRAIHGFSRRVFRINN